MQITLTRRRRTAVAAVLAAAALAVPTATAQAATSLRAQNGAGVLQRYLAANDSHFHTTYENVDYPDYGLTLDGVIAMDAAGVGDYRSDKAVQYVTQHLDDYVGDGTTGSFAGSTAKALFVSLSQNATPKGTLGGVDLVARLKGLETSSGRFSDKSSYDCDGNPVAYGTGCDYSNAIGQSLALVALAKDGKKLSYPSIAFLRQQQCSNGGFRLNPGSGACKSDPDATSFAVQGLLSAPQTSVTKTRIKKAIGYLKSQMTSKGGVHGGTATSAPNSNSTALAVMAFDSTRNKSLAAKGRKFLVSMRYGCAYPASMRGAFAYNAAGRNAAKAKGTGATLTDQDLRATTQAVLGFTQKKLKDVTNTGAKFSSPKISC